MSSYPWIKHSFLKSSISNIISLFPKLIFWSIKSIEISSLRLEYSANSFILSSEMVIGNIPFLKQLL